ncbi:hypothetical protein, partial [Maribacter sp. 2-571]|uniref:hypothetical protein n=1 Tax=Maribacter sp. 2-571 TaxID=3417569 RepID=UPI003D335569
DFFPLDKAASQGQGFLGPERKCGKNADMDSGGRLSFGSHCKEQMPNPTKYARNATNLKCIGF